MSDDGPFGAMTDIESASILQESDLPGAAAAATDVRLSGDGSPLWEYHTLGTINGIAVIPPDRGLPIDSSEVLMTAMQLDQMPRVFVGWISPEDAEGQKAYAELLERAGNHEILLDEETRQYDPAKSAYMVLVRYSEISYSLHPRFEYLRRDNE